MPGRLSQGKTPALISLDALELSEGVGWLGRLKTQGPWLVLVPQVSSRGHCELCTLQLA